MLRLLVLIVVPVISILVWYGRARRQETRYRREDEASRAARRVVLEEAAQAVDRQAELSRVVAQRIEESSVEVPGALAESIGAVVTALDCVAVELRSCQVPIVAGRRTLVHR